MAKYRKRPVVIEAFQWTGHNVHELASWAAAADVEARRRKGLPLAPNDTIAVPLHITAMPDHPETGPAHIRLEVDTLEGTVDASPGDWIICGIAGEFYPCRADIFAATYEAV